MSNQTADTTPAAGTNEDRKRFGRFQAYIAGLMLIFLSAVAAGYAIQSTKDIIGRLLILLIELYLATGAAYLLVIQKVWADTKSFGNELLGNGLTLLTWPIGAIKAISFSQTQESMANIKQGGIKGLLAGLRSTWATFRNITAEMTKMLLTLIAIFAITALLAIVNCLQIAMLLIWPAVAVYLIGMSVCFWASDLRKNGAGDADLAKLATWPLTYLAVVYRAAQALRTRRNAN